MFLLLSLPFRLVGLGFKLGRRTARVTHRTVRFVGYRRVLVLLVGVAVGLLLAPVPGAELRAKLARLVGDLGVAGAGGPDLADKVREELASSPRTWHLPQPGINIDGTTVTLSGDVPHATAAADLERTVRDVAGVREVTNNLRVI